MHHNWSLLWLLHSIFFAVLAIGKLRVHSFVKSYLVFIIFQSHFITKFIFRLHYNQNWIYMLDVDCEIGCAINAKLHPEKFHYYKRNLIEKCHINFIPSMCSFFIRKIWMKCWLIVQKPLNFSISWWGAPTTAKQGKLWQMNIDILRPIFRDDRI